MEKHTTVICIVQLSGWTSKHQTSVQIALQLHITPEINSVHQTQWQSLTSYDIKNNITVLGSIIKDGKSKRWQTCVPCQHGKMLISSHQQIHSKS